ncbi:3218_t:CDS:1, partial [Gigaspora rosea]
KNENNSFTHGMVQYQPLENIFSTIYWKHFDSLDKSNNNFSVGDIVSIAGKFGIENLEQFITIASATIVDKKDSTDEFNSEIIPFNTLYLIFNATVTRDLKTSGETIHFR